MNSITDVTIIIPTYNPDEKFIHFLEDLTKAGYEKIIVVNDGSNVETKRFFKIAEQQYGCTVVYHNINLGQGRAYKSGFNYYLGESYLSDSVGIIQCDCDGQHCVEDVNVVADLLRKNPDSFVIGTRKFSDKSIPFRSRFGNICTSFVFTFFVGMDLKDAMSGLKGIPKSFLYKLIEAPGERFEFVSSTLIEVKKNGLTVIPVPIHTIYINDNETSHFRPFLDSVRIYGLIIKFLFSSFSTFAFDVLLFSLFVSFFKFGFPKEYIFIATYLAKVISGIYNFIVNRYFVFNNKDSVVLTSLKYIFLCIVHAGLSSMLIFLLVNGFRWNESLCKILVDSLLFVFCFQIQNRWVFKGKRSE